MLARCRLFQISPLGFCRKHGSEALALESAEGKRLAKELMGSAKHFKTVIALNQFVGKALVAFTERRITPREAEAISRLAHILLLSLDRVRGEYLAGGGWMGWEKMVQANLPSDALPPGLGDYYKKVGATCQESLQHLFEEAHSANSAGSQCELHDIELSNMATDHSAPHLGDRG